MLSITIMSIMLSIVPQNVVMLSDIEINVVASVFVTFCKINIKHAD
jgi:hypothetical protein